MLCKSSIMSIFNLYLEGEIFSHINANCNGISFYNKPFVVRYAIQL